MSNLQAASGTSANLACVGQRTCYTPAAYKPKRESQISRKGANKNIAKVRERENDSKWGFGSGLFWEVH